MNKILSYVAGLIVYAVVLFFLLRAMITFLPSKTFFIGACLIPILYFVYKYKNEPMNEKKNQVDEKKGLISSQLESEHVNWKTFLLIGILIGVFGGKAVLLKVLLFVIRASVGIFLSLLIWEGARRIFPSREFPTGISLLKKI